MPRIVVLEDGSGVSKVLRDVLECQGYHVLCLTHPARVETMFMDTEPDLFLIDLMLPGINGIDLAHNLRIGRFADVPIIAISASVLKAHIAERSGLFDGTIRKPFELDTFLHVIDRCLSARRGRYPDRVTDGEPRTYGHAVPRTAPVM